MYNSTKFLPIVISDNVNKPGHQSSHLYDWEEFTIDMQVLTVNSIHVYIVPFSCYADVHTYVHVLSLENEGHAGNFYH